ncbi:hypothetical protein MMC30_002205 [Trapelia coarctata]|nr:hypothetical protein [Trapelia coarctata]
MAARTSSLPSDIPVPPLLLKLKSDLKVAMKAKDTNRLNVLRAVLAETTNASKTSSPIRTDVQLLSLLRKRIAVSKSAAEEFSAANRDDLRDKEQAQVAVMEEYAAGVKTVGQDEITEVVARIIGKMRTDGQTVNTGSALKALVGPGGEFEGKAVDKAEVARIVKGML